MKTTGGTWKIEPVFMAPNGTHFGEYRFPHQAVEGHSREYPREEALANASLMENAKDLYYICKAFAERNEDACGDHCSSACLPCAARAIVGRCKV